MEPAAALAHSPAPSPVRLLPPPLSPTARVVSASQDSVPSSFYAWWASGQSAHAGECFFLLLTVLVTATLVALVHHSARHLYFSLSAQHELHSLASTRAVHVSVSTSMRPPPASLSVGGVDATYAYLTSACSEDDVVQAMALYHSLLAVHSAYCLHVLLSAALNASVSGALAQLQLAVSAMPSSAALPPPPPLHIVRVDAAQCSSSSHILSSSSGFDSGSGAASSFASSRVASILRLCARVLYVRPDSMFVCNADSVFHSQLTPASSVSRLGEVNGDVLLFDPQAMPLQQLLAEDGVQPLRLLHRRYWSRVSIDTAATDSCTATLPVDNSNLSAEHNSSSNSSALHNTSAHTITIARFDGADTPWNWFTRLSRPTPLRDAPRLYSAWMQHARAAYNLTGSPAPFDVLHMSDMLASRRLGKHHAIRPHIPPERSVCDLPSSPSHSLQQQHQQSIDRFSVLVGHFYTGNPYRLHLLAQAIPHYRNLSAVHTVYVTWHNPNSSVPSVLRQAIRDDAQRRVTADSSAYVAPVVFLYARTDSLNNRFLPLPSTATRALFVTDEDVRLSAAEVATGFEVWQSSPQQLVGYFPRSHSSNQPDPSSTAAPTGTTTPPPQQPHWRYIWRNKDVTAEYSMILTKAMFVSSAYNYLYTCLLPRRLHAYVDLFTNGEDILFQMMVSGLTGLPPIAVDSQPDDYGVLTANGSALAGGISSGAGHYQLRSVILSDLSALLGGMTLQYNRHMVARYVRPVATSKQLDDW